MPHSDVNWVAILVAAIAGFLIGGLWYSLLFGGVWRRMTKLGDEQLQEGAALAYVLGFVATFVMAYVLARLIDFVYREPGQKTILNGMLLGSMIWTGFVATTGLTNDLLGRRPLARWILESSHFLVVLLFMGGLLAYWQ